MIIAVLSWVHLRVNYWPYKLLKAVFDGLVGGFKEASLIIKFMIKG